MMKVLVSFVCAAYVILCMNAPCAWASITQHGNTSSPGGGGYARITSPHRDKPGSSINNKHYGVITSSSSKHKNNITLLPLQLSKIRDGDYPDADRRNIKSSASKTDETGISEPPSVRIDVDNDSQEHGDYGSAIVQDIDDLDVNSDIEDEADDMISIQEKYETIVNEVNSIHSLKDVPGHLHAGISAALPDIGIITSILKFIDTFKALYTPVHTSNEECLKDVQVYGGSKNKYNGTLWSILMADAWGKLPDGFLFGNIHIPGMYEECQNVKAHYVFQERHRVPGIHIPPQFYYEDELRNITGRYCQVQYKFSNLSKTDTRSGTVFAIVKSPVPFSYGTCIPDSCTQADMEESLNVTFNSPENAGLELLRIVCHEKSNYKDLRGIDIILLAIAGVLFGLMVVLTTIDIITKQFRMVTFRRGMVFQLIEPFSFIANMKKIFTYDPPASGTITCLPAIRVITMLWIVICHQYETAADFTANTLDSLKYQDPVVTQVVANGWISVDTFLFVGGLVLSYNMFPPLLSGKLVNPFKIILRLVFRMVPSIIFLAAFCFTLLRFLAYGPRAYILEEFVDKCDSHWWKDALFINNLLFPDNRGFAVNDCLDHCWYTAVHVQLALVTVFVLLVFAKRKLFGILTTIVCSLIAVVVPLAITIAYDLPPSPLWPIRLDLSFEYMWRVYLVPWCRAGPWVVGIWTALVLRSSRLTKITIPRTVVLLGYIAAISLGMTIVLGLYPYNHILPDKKWTPTIAAFYGSLARPAWALCVAWVVFTCHTNNADMVNATLSWPGWRPLGRLTFSMYLVTPIVQIWWSTTQFVPVYYNYLSKLFESVGVIFVSGLASLFLSILVELPCLSLVGLIVPSMAASNRRSNSKPQAVSQNGLIKVPEEEMNDLQYYPNLKEITVKLDDENTERKWNMAR